MYLLKDEIDSIVPNPPERVMLCCIVLPDAGSCVIPILGEGAGASGVGVGAGGGEALILGRLGKHMEDIRSNPGRC